MRITRRALLLLLALTVLLPLLASCHGSRGLDPFAMPEAFDETKQYSITFWAKNDTNVTQTRIYEKAIADFQALDPNITGTLRLYTA